MGISGSREMDDVSFQPSPERELTKGEGGHFLNDNAPKFS